MGIRGDSNTYLASNRDVSERAIFVEHECVRIVERTGPG